jgi:hypothetical protein
LCEAAFSSGIVTENRGEGGIAKRLRKTLAKGLASTRVVTKTTFTSVYTQTSIRRVFSPKKAADDVLKKSCRLLLHKLRNHVAEDSSDSIETLVCSTNVVQPVVIKKDLLHDEDRNSLAKLGAGLHDAEAQWNNLGSEEEVDNVR